VKDETPTEALDAAAHWFSRWFGMPAVRKRDREYAGQVLDAAAPFLIAEGRRQAAAAIRCVDVRRIADLDGDTVRVGLTVAARIAESPTEPTGGDAHHHHYLSSSCYHDRPELHRECQTNATRWDGTEKIAGQCKYCEARCPCSCHTTGGGR